jgi:SAM domain (Sterile alpha motif)
MEHWTGALRLCSCREKLVSYPPETGMAGLREWLETRGLGRYADALVAQDIDLDILPQLTDADLATAGLPLGARKRLLQAACITSRIGIKRSNRV